MSTQSIRSHKPVALIAVNVLNVSAQVAARAVLEGGGKDCAPVAEAVEHEVAGLQEVLNLGVRRLKEVVTNPQLHSWQLYKIILCTK